MRVGRGAIFHNCCFRTSFLVMFRYFQKVFSVLWTFCFQKHPRGLLRADTWRTWFITTHSWTPSTKLWGWHRLQAVVPCSAAPRQNLVQAKSSWYILGKVSLFFNLFLTVLWLWRARRQNKESDGKDGVRVRGVRRGWCAEWVPGVSSPSQVTFKL